MRFSQKNIAYFTLGCVVTCLASASLAAEKIVRPKSIQAHYEVTKNGQPFANVKEQFTISGDQYKLESVTKGIGVYALFGERILTSEGSVTTDGLKPNHFELHQGDNAKKSLFADFDWAKNTLTMTVKGKPKTATLTPGAQDLASYAYQFMYIKQPFKDTVTVALTTGKKFNTYNYSIASESVTINTTQDGATTSYKTLQLTEHNAEANAAQNAERKSLWLSPTHYYLPVRILLVDEDGQKLEQTLTSLHME